MIERETSLRRVLQVLRHPDVARWYPSAQAECFIPPMGERALYFKVGRGLMAYYLHDGWAEMHAALLRGDGGPAATAAIREQLEQVLKMVPRVVAVPKNERARAKAVAVGMVFTGQRRDGLPVYEVTHG